MGDAVNVDGELFDSERVQLFQSQVCSDSSSAWTVNRKRSVEICGVVLALRTGQS